MKNIRNLLVVWILALSFFFFQNQEVNAYKMRYMNNSLSSSCWSNGPCTDSSNTLKEVVYWNWNEFTKWAYLWYSDSEWANITTSSYTKYSNVFARATQAFGRQYYAFGSFKLLYISRVYTNVTDDWGIEFHYWNETRNVWQTYYVPSRAWFLYTFKNGSQLVMDEVFFYHDSIIFRNSETGYTYQILWWWWLENVILLAAPQSTQDNLRYISRADWKAWSATVSQAVAWQFMLWSIPITDQVLKTVNWDQSYSINVWGSYLFPEVNWWDFRKDKGEAQRFTEEWENVWYVYSASLNFEAPVFWDTVDVTTGSTSFSTGMLETIDNSALTEYNACILYNGGQNAVSKSIYQCRNQYEKWNISFSWFTTVRNYIQSDDIVNNRSSEYPITENDYCNIMVENARSLAKKYYIDWEKGTGSRNSDITRIIQNSLISDWQDIVNVEQLCWTRPVTQTVSNACDWSSWAWIINCLWMWSSSSESWSWSSWDSTLFEKATNNLSTMVSNSILWKFITPIQTRYEEGYRNVSWLYCQSSSYVDLPFANDLVYIVWIILFLILYSLL